MQQVTVRAQRDPGCCALFLALGLIALAVSTVGGWLSGGGWRIILFPALALAAGWVLWLAYTYQQDVRGARRRAVPTEQTRIEREARNLGLTVDAWFERKARATGKPVEQLKREAHVPEWRDSSVTPP